MSDPEKALPVILAHEGGYSDDPNDPGGATKYGISLRFLRTQGLDLDGDGDVDGDDVRGITMTAALAIYRARIWDREGYGRIVDQQVATKLFDMAVNLGPFRAHRLCQHALRACVEDVEVDGVLGSESVKAINDCEPRELLLELCKQHERYYDTLCELKPRFEVYRRGWMKRAHWPFGPDEYVPSQPLAAAPVPPAKLIA